MGKGKGKGERGEKGKAERWGREGREDGAREIFPLG